LHECVQDRANVIATAAQTMRRARP
jgi:hypothetical protein